MNKYSLIVLALLVITSCIKEESIEAGTYKVSGMVTDSTGAGIPGIKVYFQTNAFVLTDAAGKWESGSIADRTVITPSSNGYSFTPGSVDVHEANTLVNFVATSLYYSNPSSENVHQWFLEMQTINGLIESTAGSNTVSLYDNALAAMVYIANGDYAQAEAIFDFFESKRMSELNSGNGGFYQFRTVFGVPSGNRWMGDNAWLLIALNNYEAYTNSSSYSQLQADLTTWIRSLQHADGSVWGGFDQNGNAIGVITEGNIDAYNAVAGYDDFHVQLLQYLGLNRWDTTDHLLVSWPDNPPYYYALDNFAWGYCAFENYPDQSLLQAQMFVNTQMNTTTGENVTGYCFDTDNDAVWLEGSGEMVVALQKAGNVELSNYYLQQMEHAMTESLVFPGTFGLPYATNQGTGYGNASLWTGASTNPCISSSAWYLFSMMHFDPFAVGYVKNAPEADRFW